MRTHGDMFDFFEIKDGSRCVVAKYGEEATEGVLSFEITKAL